MRYIIEVITSEPNNKGKSFYIQSGSPDPTVPCIPVLSDNIEEAKQYKKYDKAKVLAKSYKDMIEIYYNKGVAGYYYKEVCVHTIELHISHTERII